MKKILSLLVSACMLLALCACGSTSTTPTDTDLSDEEMKEILSTMSDEQIETVDELIAIAQYYSAMSSWLYNDFLRITDEANIASDRLEIAENAILTGTPLPLALDIESADGTIRTDTFTLMTVSESNTPYKYEAYLPDEKIVAMRFPVSPGDCLEVNGTEYGDNGSGIVEIVYESESPSTFEVRLISDDCVPSVAQFGVASTQSASDQLHEDQEPTPPDVMGNEKFQQILETMDDSQRRVISEILDIITAFQDKCELYQDLTGLTQEIYDIITYDLAAVENALLNGIPFQMSVENETYITSFYMMAVEADSPIYTFPNPWGGLSGEKMVFVTIPHSDVIINDHAFHADENGIVEVPLEGKSIPTMLDISVHSGDITYIVNMDGDGNNLSEALSSIV